MPKTKTDETEQLAEEMTVVRWGRFERTMMWAIVLLVILNLIVGVLALGPDLWGSLEWRQRAESLWQSLA